MTTLTLPVARSAKAPSVIEPRVGEVVGVTSRTVRFATPGTGTNTSHDIDVPRNGFQVGGIHARPIPTEMVNIKTVGDGTNQGFVGKSVGQDIPPNASSPPEHPISHVVPMGRPYPAPVRAALVHLRPKALFWWSYLVRLTGAHSTNIIPDIRGQ